MSSLHHHHFLAAALTLAAALCARADVTLPAIFSDHLVLQRGMPVPVWGWADPGETVTVSVAGQTQTAQAAADGKWLVKFADLSAAEPTSLVINGKNRIVISDVLIGEVWLGSGQSNLALTLMRGAQDPEAEKAAANYPRIRIFKEESFAGKTPQKIGQGKWVLCSPETVGESSAVMYFFGRELYSTLKVPVGLVDSSRGGTTIESWIDFDAQNRIPELKGSFKAAAEENAAAAGKAEPDDAGKSKKQKKMETHALRVGGPGGLFNGKIAPLIPYAIRGLIWYQGEANTQPQSAPYYAHQLPLLITDWRERWGYDFPAAWAQLPVYGAPGRNWPLVREAELKALSLPKTGMVIGIDTGDEKELHPRNKLELGHRFALWALGTVYGLKVPTTSGPLPAGHEVRGHEIVVRFTHADGGLVAKDGALKSFVIAGEDKRWQPAQARIEGDTVVISSPGVSKPVAARYGWENAPVCNLYNGAGLPASPFRTDNWQ